MSTRIQGEVDILVEGNYLENIKAVTRINRTGILYIIGTENEDGSIRFIFTPPDPTAHIEARANGVWNHTGFQFSASSTRLGFDMILSAVAGYVQTTNPGAIAGHLKSLLAHIEFNDAGTTGTFHFPIVNKKQLFIVFPGPAVSEVVGPILGQVLNSIPRRLLNISTHQVGSIPSTAEVRVRYYAGTSNAGDLIFSVNLPADSMKANQSLVIEYNDDFGFDGNKDIFMEFFSEANISLKTNIDGNILIEHEGQELDEIGILGENLMLDEELNLMFDEDLNPMYSTQF